MPTPETRYNLLTEFLLSVRTLDGGAASLTLPGVLSALQRREVLAFSALQLHQEHAWHAFLVHLAALALVRAGAGGDALRTELDWAELLRSLVRGDEAAFCLVAPDVARPAFFQPPVPEGALTRFKDATHFPDDFDVLVTSKNHDVKMARVASPSPEHWAYALVTLQTMQGYLGRGNYGIARMNGGFGSRPAVTHAPGLGLGERWAREVQALLDARDELLEAYEYTEAGPALLWLEPWDGTTSLSLQALDPFFVEVCRRVRLTHEDGRVVGRMAPTQAPRVKAEEGKGDTGDAWTPVDKARGAAFTASDAGFSYERVQQLLLQGDFTLGPVGERLARDGEGRLFSATVLARGQGETNGFHQRTLPLPGRVRLLLSKPDGRERLGRLAKQRVEAVGTMKKNVLRLALTTVLQAGADSLNFREPRTKTWVEKRLGLFEARVDAVFFEELWAAADLPAEEGLATWVRRLKALALEELADAKASAPIPEMRRYRTASAADRAFYGSFKKHFPALNTESATPDTGATAHE